MSSRKTIVGLCMLCALASSAFAAQGARAATKGTTAFTCKEVAAGTGHFNDAHCKTAGTGASFDHIAIPETTKTEVSVTNTLTGGETETAKLKATIAGVATEFIAKTTNALGTMENKKEASGEHYVHGEGVTTYIGISVVKPEGAGCKIKGESIKTENLTGTSAGQGDFGKLAPKGGSLFGTFTIEGCKGEAFEALNKEYKVEGSVRCVGEGSTAKCNHAEITAQNTLKLNGTIKAGVEVSTTFKGRANSSEPFTPLSVTTVETP